VHRANVGSKASPEVCGGGWHGSEHGCVVLLGSLFDNLLDGADTTSCKISIIMLIPGWRIR
jgi:hypothetical protein